MKLKGPNSLKTCKITCSCSGLAFSLCEWFFAVLYVSMLVHDSTPTNAPTHTLISSAGEKTDSYELVFFNLLKQFLCVWNKLSHLICNTSIFVTQTTSVVIKLKKVNEITRLICQHDFIFFWGGWNDNISWMVLKLHYKRAIVCFYQVVRFLRGGGLWTRPTNPKKKCMHH